MDFYFSGIRKFRKLGNSGNWEIQEIGKFRILENLRNLV